jgi:hypothetical protein
MQVENAMTLAAHSIFFKVKMQVENAMTLAAHSIIHAGQNASRKCNDPGCTLYSSCSQNAS